jgi:hypothetical protein
MGAENAIMPMKCIDQMPMPMDTDPNASQGQLEEPCDSATRAARRSDVKDAKIAMPIDRDTSQGL